MLTNMLVITAIWMLIFIIVSGIGFFLLKMLGVTIAKRETLFSAFWLGWASIIMFLQIWHIFSPINTVALVIVLLAGVISVLLGHSRFETIIFNHSGNNKLVSSIFIVCTILFILWLANQATGKLTSYDTGLYHLGTIRWMQSYPIVIGLGNLHPRFAYNSSYFLFVALLDLLWWRSDFFNLSNGLLLSVISVQIGAYIFTSMTNKDNLKSYQVLGILLAASLLPYYFTLTNNTSSDLPVFILGLMVGIHVFKFLFNDKTHEESRLDALIIVILCATGISIKLSFAVFSCLAVVVVMFTLLIYKPTATQVESRFYNMVWALALSVLILIPWGLRGIMLSGYIAYPIPTMPLDVRWRIPEQLAKTDARWIKSWAQQPYNSPDNVLGNWKWFKPWLQRMVQQRLEVVLPILLFLMGIIIYLTSARAKIKSVYRDMLFLMIPIIALVFWFFTAPNIRFAGGSFWLLGAGTMAISIHHVADKKLLEIVSLSSLLLAIFAFVISARLHGWVVYPGPDQGFYPTPKFQVHQFQTRSGLTIFVPNTGDKCWDAPLPCTPYPNPDLATIESGNISSGFFMQASQSLAPGKKE
ncbi:MAG: hypothetical protein KDI79_14200 [Anaerolineae bacterium]|nr:hypothetical protein [Anaerolineae bacterium]